MSLKFPIDLDPYDRLLLTSPGYSAEFKPTESAHIANRAELLAILQEGEGVTGEDFVIITIIAGEEADGTSLTGKRRPWMWWTGWAEV